MFNVFLLKINGSKRNATSIALLNVTKLLKAAAKILNVS